MKRTLFAAAALLVALALPRGAAPDLSGHDFNAQVLGYVAADD